MKSTIRKWKPLKTVLKALKALWRFALENPELVEDLIEFVKNHKAEKESKDA